MYRAFHIHAAKHLVRRRVALALAVCLAAASVTIVESSPAGAAGSPGITLAKTAPSSVLAGQSVAFSLTASNPSSNPGVVPEYNVSFRDVLPVGLAYQPGSTTPADVGDPTVYTDAGTGAQTLVWPDTFDLQPNATSGISFTAAVNPATLPVGSTVLNTGNAYASTAPRYVPKFTATGTPVANAQVQSATSNQTSTSVTALAITKSEPSPESKLLRGVHDHPTVYTLTVTDTGQAATNATTVVDYLPAEEEFLGCGQLDNSAGVEYPGAPSLTATPAVSNCPTPASVDTVANPPANGSVSYPPGVYTKVTWNLGTLAAGQTVTIRYAAGIPLRANVLFAGGPSAASLGQTANLDNNTGPSTRQISAAASQTNYAHAAGTYTGPVASGQTGAVVADAAQTVTVNDLRVYKSVSPSEFVAGAISTYTLHVDSGEYTDNSAITITDVLPNGICPLDDSANYVTGAPAECAPGAGFAPSLPYQSVTQNADGTFTVVFQPIAVAKDGSTVITYQGRDRTVYTGGALAGEPIAAGDSFTNSAQEQGTSTPVAATGFTGTQPVQDATSATQTTSFGALSKTVAARATPMSCTSSSYGATNTTFVKGDRVCFQITVPFSTTNQTRNAVVTDFLPDNTTYEAGSVTYPAANTVDPAQITFDSAGAASGALSWTLGATQPDGSTEVPVGKVFVAQFSAIILDTAAGPAPDKPGNVVKLRTTNSAGVARSLRDQANFQIAAAPPVGLTKGVASVNGSTPANPANTDHVAVKEGDAVVFRVDATNNGTAANANNVPISNVQTWDVLPAGIACAQISAISDGGTCTNPGDAGQPSFSGNGTRSALVWNVAATLAPAATATYTYTMTIPAGVSVSADLVNTAAVRSYTVTNDLSGTSTLYPAANIDTSVPAANYDAPAASDNSDVYLRDVAVSKGVVSAVNETGNIGAEASPQPGTQATPGEQVTFTTSATVPAHSTVYNASFTDPIPTGLTLNGATATYRPDAGSATTAALPAGVTFSAASPPTFTFPAIYDNTTGTDQVFTMTLVETLSVVAGNQHGIVRSNTAAFTSQTAATGGTNLPNRSASATVTDVEPQPSLTKTNNAGGPVAGGQTLTYTLKPSNGAGRPPLHDAWQLDCLPAGLTFAAYGSLPAGVSTSTPVAGNGSNGCSTNYTVLAWNLGDLAGGSTLTLTYTATVDTTAAGKNSLTNVAALSGNSLAGARTSPVDPGNPGGRQYSAAANSTVTIAGATGLKSVSPTSATVGDTVTYSTSALLPAGVNFYGLSLIDQLPNGIDPNSVTLGAVSCTNADTTACTPNAATPLTPVAGPGSSTIIGWLLGDATSAAQARTVTVHYTARIADVAAATAGAGLTNQMHVGWNNAPGAAPTSAGATYNQSSPTVTATVTVLEPSLSIAKSTTKATPEPGQTYGYSLVVTNANTALISTAYNVTVTDTVPTGVVVDPASISGGGTISGANASTGGGTISWTLPGSIPRGTSTTALTYSATLAPSATLTSAALVNTARVTGYDSLPAGGRHYTGPSTTATVTPHFPRVSTVKTTPAGTTAYLGQSFAWKITATDVGLGAGYQVATTDTLPANWTYDAGSAQVSVNGGPPSQLDPAVTTSNGVQTLSWTGLGNLPAGTALTITFTSTPQAAVTATPGVGLAVNQTNTATSTIQDLTGATGNASGGYSAGPGTAVAHIASADVTLAKAVGTAPVAGLGGSWTLTVHNSGPDTATGPFTVTDGFDDPAPSGVANVTAAGTGWSCANATPVTCQRTASTDTLASGATFPTITLSYTLDAAVPAGTTLTNSASVTARTYDPTPGNNTATASANVSSSADLAVTKTLSSPTLVAGGDASYSVSVANNGPSAAAGPITITDPLPAGTSFVSVSGAGWTCDPITSGTIGATLTCRLAGPLAVGSVPDALIVTVGIPSGQTAAVSNTATVGSPTTDPMPSNNSSTVTSTPVVQADLSIQKRHLTATFVAGQTAQYQIDVNNAGPSDAAATSVTDTLPTGLSYHGFSSADPNWGCAAAGATVTCTYGGTFTAGATSSILLTVDLASNFVGPVVNTASVSSTTTDPVPRNNTDSDNSSVSSAADLSIVKTDSGTATAGGSLGYTLAVHNAGPSDVLGAVTVEDSLPVGLAYVSATGTGWSCGYATATRLVTCTLAAGLATASDAAPITVATTVDPSVGPSTISNTASVSSGTTDPVLANNSSTDPVQIVTHADLSLTKVLTSTPPVTAGTDATFTLVASNAGPSDASSVSVSDTLGAGLSFGSYTGSGWTCAATGQVVVCSRPSIAAGTSAPDLVINALVSPSTPVTLPAGTATLVNNASIDSSTPGTRTNPPQVDVPVQARADLSLVKTPKNATVVAGSTFTWNLAVGNTGPSDAASPITVVDTLPAEQSFLSSTSAGWACSGATTVTCVLNQVLAAGASAPPLALTVQIDAAAPAGTETNTATAGSPTPGSPASDTAVVTVTRTAGLSLTKTHSGPVAVGSPLPFTLVAHNAGPSVADQVVITDQLPAGLTYVSSAGTGWTCTPDGVTCTLAGTIAVGADSPPLLITTTVEASAYPSVTNTATVGSTDPTLPGTSSASDPVTVPPSATLTLTKKHVGTLVVGKNARYDLVVRNSGPTATPGPISVVDTLPAGLGYVSSSGSPWTCSVTGTRVTCTEPGPLAAGATLTLGLTLAVGAAAYPSVVNTAAVNAPGATAVTATDTAPVTPTVVLGVVKTLKSYQGGVASFVITVTDKGPSATTEPLVLTDPLPAGLTYQSASGVGWTCGLTGTTVRCTHPALLAVGASAAVTVTALVDATPGTTITNIASVAGGTTTDAPPSPSNGARVVASATGNNTGSSGGQLSQTGRDVRTPALAALLMMLGGVALLVAARRRRHG